MTDKDRILAWISEFEDRHENWTLDNVEENLHHLEELFFSIKELLING